MDWYPQQLLWLNRRPQVFVCFCFPYVLFLNVTAFVPQALFTAKQVAAGAFCFLERDMPF